MRVFIDADGCPVVGLTIAAAKRHGLACYILCDTAHVFEKEYATTITVSKGADSVDFKLVNLIKPGDAVVTQDYGLAAMCLARGAFVLNQDGLEYTSANIDALLASRHAAKKIRLAGGRLKGPSKRLSENDRSFEEALEKLLSR